MALLAAAVVVVVLVLGGGNGSAPATTAGSTAAGAATVQRRDLVETDTESGTLGYAGAQTVYNRLSGTVTWVPAVGRVIKPGEPLYDIDGEPVLLLNGSTPAYRELDSSDGPGNDIEQLNRNLVELGYNPDGIVVDDDWQAATTAGVEALQEAFGEQQTGSLPLGQVVFLPGAQLISTVDATVGSTGSGGGSPAAADDDSDADTSGTSDPGTKFVSLESATTAATTSTTPTTTTGTTTTTTKPSGSSSSSKHHRHKSATPSLSALTALIAKLEAKIAKLEQGSPGGHASSPSDHSSSPSGSSSSPKDSDKSGDSGNDDDNGGGGGGSATEIMQTTSTRLVVTVDLPATQQSEAKAGEKVSVEMPAGNTVEGRITSVSSVAQSSSSDDDSGNNSGNSSPTIPVTVALDRHVSGAGLDQAAVSVNFVEAEARHVLSVPVTALLATSGDSYAVQEATYPHKLIPVTTGLFAAGYVQISGAGIYPGLQVTDSQG